ncbi:MAG: DUF342 domain-containing protein [Firmicutes bacterium]|nr:DUF342 domain-containing protein [Candidatus Fermentithermobacillaceae bacterium]
MQPSSGRSTSGLAWVEKGKLMVTDPGPGEAPAKIRPCDGVEVFVEGVKIAGETEVTASSDVLLRPVEQLPEVAFKFQISQDDLEAYVLLEAIDGVRCKVKDTEPSHALQLEVEREVVPACVDPQSLIEGAEKAGIRFGLDTKACHMVCREKPSKSVLIASGIPAAPGQDGKLEFSVPLEKVVELPLDEIRVDFRSSIRIPDVKAGQTIAVKKPAKPGLPGKGVSGKTLHPKKPRDPRLRAGKGVELRQQGELIIAVATTSGWPRYNESSGIVEVDEVYYHRGDVDLSSGNLKTSGSIEVAGSVFEGMKVESEGNQIISGTVTDAELSAWGSITVRGNVFKSRLSAGKDVRWLHRWNDLLANVEENLVRIMELRDLDNRLAEEAENGDGEDQPAEVISVSDSEVLFDYFRQLIIALSNLYKEDLSQLPTEIVRKILAARDKIGRKGDVYQRAQAVEDDISHVRSWIDYELSRGESDIIVPYVQSSYLETSRDIIVTGQGALYSNLSAGRAIKVAGSPGIVRGGEVTAAELIQVNEAGGRGSAQTVLRVSEKGRIVARTVHPNTTLILGRLKARTENLLESVEIRIVKDRLVISSRSGTITMDD